VFIGPDDYSHRGWFLRSPGSSGASYEYDRVEDPILRLQQTYI
jgi:hypothetical protein